MAVTLNNLGQTLHPLRRSADAESSYRQAPAIAGTAAWSDDVALALTRNNLALLYLDAQRLAEAEPLLKEAAQTLLARLPATACGGLLSSVVYFQGHKKIQSGERPA